MTKRHSKFYNRPDLHTPACCGGSKHVLGNECPGAEHQRERKVTVSMTETEARKRHARAIHELRETLDEVLRNENS